MDVLRTRGGPSVGALVVGLGLLVGCTKLRSTDERREDEPPDAGERTDGDASTDSGSGSDSGSDAGLDSDAGMGSDASLCDGPCPCVPVVASCDRTLVAHGARLVIRGECLEAVDDVSVGGVSQRYERAAGPGRVDLVVDTVDDTTPVGVMRPLVVSSPLGSSAAFPITVAHLVISELDAISGGDHDDREFVEIATGLDGSVDLAGYALVFVDGATDATYAKPMAFVLGATNTNGRYVVGNSGVQGVSQRFPRGSLGQGRQTHAALLVQIAATATPPAPSTPISALGARVIDAIAFGPLDAEHDTSLLAWCFPLEAGRAEVHEASGGAATDHALRRCGAARRDGRVFGVARPTPNAPNGCP